MRVSVMRLDEISLKSTAKKSCTGLGVTQIGSKPLKPSLLSVLGGQAGSMATEQRTGSPSRIGKRRGSGILARHVPPSPLALPILSGGLAQLGCELKKETYGSVYILWVTMSLKLGIFKALYSASNLQTPVWHNTYAGMFWRTRLELTVRQRHMGKKKKKTSRHSHLEAGW